MHPDLHRYELLSRQGGTLVVSDEDGELEKELIALDGPLYHVMHVCLTFSCNDTHEDDPFLDGVVTAARFVGLITKALVNETLALTDQVFPRHVCMHGKVIVCACCRSAVHTHT